MYGPALSPGAEAVSATGVDEARPNTELSAALKTIVRDRRTIYTPFAAEVLGSQSQGDPTKLWAANKRDEWDGRDSREQTFISKLKALSPDLAAKDLIKDLDPIVNRLRAVKSAREIQVIRDATRLAGIAIVEAMRAVRPGMTEYELQASGEFVFKKGGAFGPSYFALIATGENTYYSHYNRNTATVKDGDLVQFDYAPDYKYYQSDVTRIFPANGTFTARQREMYTIYLKLYQALMTSIRVHASPQDVATEAGRKMSAIIAAFPFTDDLIREAATNMVLRSNPIVSGFVQVRTPVPGSIVQLRPLQARRAAHPTAVDCGGALRGRATRAPVTFQLKFATTTRPHHRPASNPCRAVYRSRTNGSHRIARVTSP